MIEEIPINSDVNEINSEPVEQMVEEAVEAEPVEEPAPKKRGRPFGAKSKAKPAQPKSAQPKPRAAPKVAAEAKKRQRVVEESESEEEEIVVKRKTRRPAPEPEARIPTTQDVAFEVMQLLSNRHVDQAAQRRAKYASWFQ